MSHAAVEEEVETASAVVHDNAEVGDEAEDGSSILSDISDDEVESDERADISDAIRIANGAPNFTRLSLEADSEAETDIQTPHKLLKHAESIGLTPSKLVSSATLDDELSEPPSPLPTDVGAASSTSTIARAGTLQQSEDTILETISLSSATDIASVGLKRKRSNDAESPLTSPEPDLDEIQRKHSHGSPPKPSIEDEAQDTPLDIPAVVEEEIAPHHEQRIVPNFAKGAKGKKGKQKGGRKPKDQAPSLTTAASIELGDARTPPEAPPTRTAEANHQLTLLMSSVSAQHKLLRDAIIATRLRQLDDELAQLAQPECTHPEYLAQVRCVDERLEKQQNQAYANHHYRSTATRERVLGERVGMHSQYFQRIREVRETTLEELNREWAGIHSERREQGQDKNDALYTYKYPTKRSSQVKQQAAYNHEVAILSGVAKYVGFPSAPEIAAVTAETRDEDMRAMRVSLPPSPHSRHCIN